MLEHTATGTEPLGGVVVVGAGGFVGNAICTRLAAEKVPHLALTRKDIDLLEPEAGYPTARGRVELARFAALSRGWHLTAATYQRSPLWRRSHPQLG